MGLIVIKLCDKGAGIIKCDYVKYGTLSIYTHLEDQQVAAPT